MKKIILITVLLLSINVNVRANSDLNIDLNTLKDSKETYSSITDLYKLPIFSDDYKEKIEDKKNKEEEEKENLKNTLFIKERDYNSSEDKTKEKSLELNLFDKRSKDINYIKDYEKSKSIDIKSYIIIFFITLLSLIFMMIYKNKKNKDELNEDYSNL